MTLQPEFRSPLGIRVVRVKRLRQGSCSVDAALHSILSRGEGVARLYHFDGIVFAGSVDESGRMPLARIVDRLPHYGDQSEISFGVHAGALVCVLGSVPQ